MCLAAFRSQASATDLSGHWVNDRGTLFEISQTGDAVSIPMPAFNSAFPYGTLDSTLSGSTLAGQYGGLPFRARVLAGDGVIDANLPLIFGFNAGNIRLVATRCECFDGNTTNSDGCDARCRVEPCFSCEGEPSICTPLGDGAACSDHHDCTSGETCSSGVCSGGTTVPSCIDMTGRWKVETSGGNPGFLLEDLRDVEQRDGIVRFSRPTTGGAEVGTLDQATRSLELSGAVLYGDAPYFYSSLNEAIGSCDVSLAGTVSADGQTFSGSGSGGNTTIQVILHQAFPGLCGGDFAFSQTAHRCADGECLVVPDECPPCQTGNAPNRCVPGPRPGCLHSLDPARSKLQILAADPDKQRLTWQWTDGAAVPSRMLGDLSLGSGLQVCIFDANSNVLFRAYWNPYDRGWDTRDGVSFSQTVFTPGGQLKKERVSIEPGADKQSELKISAYNGGLGSGIDPEYGIPGSGLPLSPFDLPLRIQATIDRGGACFESKVDSTTVRKNADGSFKGKAAE